MKSILDRSFKYTPSHETAVSKTFAKARRALKEQAMRQAEAIAEASWSTPAPLTPGVVLLRRTGGRA